MDNTLPKPDNIIRDDFTTDKVRGGLGNDHLIHHRDPSVTGSSGVGLAGFEGDDILEASVPDAGQIHMFAAEGDDWLILDVTKLRDASGTQGHHAYGGPGQNTFQFKNIAANLSPIIGRLDDFNPTSDRILIEDTLINLTDLPQSLRLADGQEIEVRVIKVEHPEFMSENLGFQHFLAIGDNIFYALEGARELQNGTSGMVGEERHFLKEDALEILRGAEAVQYVNPTNFVPRELYADRENSLTLNWNQRGDEVFAEPAHETAVHMFGSKNNPDAPSSSGAQAMWGSLGNDVINGNNGNDTIFGMDGSDLIAGGIDDDVVYGGYGDDTIWGGDGNDILNGGAGSDYLHGGAGHDTATYENPQSGYTLILDPISNRIIDRRADGDGTDELVDIEVLMFAASASGGALDLTQLNAVTSLSADDLESLIDLYIACFDRAPDALGLNFWARSLANGVTLDEIAAEFVNNTTIDGTYSYSMSSDAFVRQVYENALGRTPDEAGFTFWTQSLEAETVTRAQFLLEFLHSAKSQLQPEMGQGLGNQPLSDREYLAHKTDIGAYFAVHKGMSNADNASAAMALFNGSRAGLHLAVERINTDYDHALDPVSGEFLLPLLGVLEDTFSMI